MVALIQISHKSESTDSDGAGKPAGRTKQLPKLELFDIRHYFLDIAPI